MKVYHCKSRKLPGSSYKELHTQARKIYKTYIGNTRRQPYIKSAYFNKEKIFIQLFWLHIWKKNWKDRKRRIAFLPCGLELVKKSKIKPISKPNPNKSGEIVYRFTGVTRENELFYVQIKEVIKTKTKYLLSIFPVN